MWMGIAKCAVRGNTVPGPTASGVSSTREQTQAMVRQAPANHLQRPCVPTELSDDDGIARTLCHERLDV
jgi:hypothetical protein